MAGRRAHIDQSRFQEFIDSIPETARGNGYWRVKRQIEQPQGGITQSYVGYMEFIPGETYEQVRARLKETFAMKYGPGVYYGIICDDRKCEIKDLDMARFEFKESEVPMPEPPAKTENPLEAVKKVHKDVAEVKAMALQEKLLEKFLKDGDEEKEEGVKDTSALGGGLQDLLVYKMMFQDEKRSAPDATTEKLLDAKLEAKMNEIRAMLAERRPEGESRFEKLLERLIERQNQPSNDRFEKLIEKLFEKESSEKQKNAFESMLAMMIQQQSARDKEREAEERRREQERAEERRRWEEDRKAERERFEAERRAERERMAEEARRREEERKAELQRLEEERRLEREKFLKELEERQKRFEAEIALRREELKNEAAKSREYVAEQQKMQLQLLSIFKENKDASLDVTSKIVDTLTSAGLSSMKTAQQAAESIMSIAKQVDREDKEEGLSGFLKSIGQVAAPVLGAYANADAQMKMLQSISKVAGAGGLESLLGGLGGARIPAATIPAMPEIQVPQVRGVEAGRPLRSAEGSKLSGGANVIAQFLQKFPDVKYAMIGNLQDKLGVDLFLPILLGLDQPALESLIANIPTVNLMNAVRSVCTPEERAIVDANVEWFKELKRAMIEEIRAGEEEEEEEETSAGLAEPAKPVAPNSAPQPGPTASTT